MNNSKITSAQAEVAAQMVAETLKEMLEALTYVRGNSLYFDSTDEQLESWVKYHKGTIVEFQCNVQLKCRKAIRQYQSLLDLRGK